MCIVAGLCCHCAILIIVNSRGGQSEGRVASMHGSRPVSNMSALQYRVFLSGVQRSSCSEGIMYVCELVVLVSLLVL